MLVLPMTRREICHQRAPVGIFRLKALSGGVRRIPRKVLVRHELVQLSDVAPVEGINETLGNLPDRLGRALAWRT